MRTPILLVILSISIIFQSLYITTYRYIYFFFFFRSLPNIFFIYNLIIFFLSEKRVRRRPVFRNITTDWAGKYFRRATFACRPIYSAKEK